MTNSATTYDDRRSRAEVLTDAVISAYVHEISGRHRPASPEFASAAADAADTPERIARQM
jgi:hypothetical protein